MSSNKISVFQTSNIKRIMAYNTHRLNLHQLIGQKISIVSQNLYI